MSLRRVAGSVVLVGFVFIVGALASWFILRPTTQWLQHGYVSCLWSSTYQVPPEYVPDRSEIGSSGQKLQFINPQWDPNRASCGTKGNDVHFDYGEQAKRQVAIITKGYDPGARVHAVPPFFLMAPFLNVVGVAALVLGCALIFAAPSLTAPSYDVKQWNAFLQHDDDIKRIVDALIPFGEKYVDEFAQAFMTLRNKDYLPQIIEKILASARADISRAK
ncbi:MAG: hypothetical protein J0H40_21165 [Rhizobiales bacterium]|nr:hypothetical protein [Hyphomicrobiales bacterium]